MPFAELDKLEPREVLPGLEGRFIHGERSTLVYWEYESGTVLPPHTHEHEQITNVLEGELELTIKGETHTLEPGMVAVIPGGVKHRGFAFTHCKVLDVFIPVREDYK